MADSRHVAADTASSNATVADEGWFAALVASSSEVIVGLDVDGRVLSWNQGAVDLYGYSAEEMVGQPVFVLRSASDAGHDRLRAVLARLMRGERVEPYESQNVRKDGSVVDVSVTPCAVRGREGGIIGCSAIVRDISAINRNRESLELAVAHERLLVEKLTDLDRVRTSFVSSISHELRTPLTSILGYLELLLDDPAGMNEPQREMLDVVSRNSHRLLALIENLLVLSRIESGAFKVLKEPVDVGGVITAVTREAAPQIAAAGHTLTVSMSDDVDEVLGDRVELERLMQSLLSNAIKFTPAGGDISIRADRTEAGTRITVADTGMGIDEDDFAEVFAPFFRSVTADRRAIPGTGLGLAIARSVVEQHSGTISCASEQGGGTAITVVLPFSIQQRKAS